MSQNTTVHLPSTAHADYEEIQALFSARSARQYAAGTRRLRTERHSDQPSATPLTRVFDHLNWHARHVTA